MVESETKVHSFFSRVHATLQPAMSVGRSVRRSVRVNFFGFTGVFCVTAPAHPHATSARVYGLVKDPSLMLRRFVSPLQSALIIPLASLVDHIL